MSYMVSVSDQAEKDLRDVFEYIVFTLQVEQAAAGQLARLQRTILSLDTMPHRYPVYKREPWRSRGLRFVPVDHYMVFYLVDEMMQTVSVARVLYGSRDLPRQLASME